MKIKRLQQPSVVTLVALLLLPLLFAFSPAIAQPTYNVMIRSPLINGLTANTSVPIIMDGQPTNHNTPWDFMGLTGVHNFTVPYEDSSGHSFRCWTNTFLGINGVFTTITLSPENASSSGLYYAQYNAVRNMTSMTWPEARCFITPTDPAVIAAADNMTWDEIVDWVATNITPNNPGRYQFPNETLAVGYGVCREYSGLAVSMLKARGYEAYIVAGNTTGHLDINHAWIAIELNGTLYHIEPQRTMDRQPEPLMWVQNRTAWFFYNDKVIIPATATQDLPPPPTDTYTVTIVASSESDYITSNDYDIHAQIFLDGKDTGYITPHTFRRLKGNHTFSVAYQDITGKPFFAWTTNVPGFRFSPSLVLTEAGTYCALYQPLNYTIPPPSQMLYFITPNDSAVITAAAGKNWSQIVEYVSSLPYLFDFSNSPVLFPNQTLNGGYHLQEFTLLCCSMLLANGYTAYFAENANYRGVTWVVLDINGTLTAINPHPAFTEQFKPSIKANYYADQSGIYPAILTEGPKIPTSTPTPSSTYTDQSSSTTSNPKPVNPTPSPTIQPQSTPEPSATVPETPAFIAAIILMASTITTLVLRKKSVGIKQ